jgi:putative transcriptional regulator
MEGDYGAGQVDLTLFMVTSMLVTMKSEVRTLRTAAGLSQGALATAVGVSRQTINAIETGRYDPSLRLAAQLSRYFEQSIEEIFDVED